MPIAPPRRRGLLAVVTVLMCALAAGAVWCVLVLHLHRAFDLFALAVAALLAWVVRSHGYAGSRAGAALAAAAVALACLYARSLIATAEVAQTLGMSLREAMAKIGPEFALALAIENLDYRVVACFLLAMALAAGLVLRR